LTAALPLLERAERVVLAGVTEGADDLPQTPKHLAWQLGWHGIAAESREIGGKGEAKLPVFILH
jgi:hypothetical protein